MDEDRMDQHFNVIAYLNIAYGVLILAVALFIGALLSAIGAASGDPDAMRVLGSIGGLLSVFLVIVGAPYVIAGYGLLKRTAWGRILTMVVDALALFSIPFGTALGVYALWALTRPEAEDAFF